MRCVFFFLFVLTLCAAVRGPEARAEPRAEEEGGTAAAAAAEQTGADRSRSADGPAAESAAHGTVALTGQCGKAETAAHDGRKEEVRGQRAGRDCSACSFFLFLSLLPSLIHARMSFYFLFATRESIEQRIEMLKLQARESIENLARAADPLTCCGVRIFGRDSRLGASSASFRTSAACARNGVC